MTNQASEDGGYDILGKLICYDCGVNCDLMDCMIYKGESTVNAPLCRDCINKRDEGDENEN